MPRPPGRRRGEVPSHFKRGVYILPSMFTVALSRADGVTGSKSLGAPNDFSASGSLIVTPSNVNTVIGTFIPQ